MEEKYRRILRSVQQWMRMATNTDSQITAEYVIILCREKSKPLGSQHEIAGITTYSISKRQLSEIIRDRE
jgi:hypothetical protein